MAGTAASTYTTNALNYQGVAARLAPHRTPLMTLILNANKVRGHGNKVINMSKEWTPDAASQPAISEATALAAPSETSYLYSQNTNVKQIFHEACEVSYAKQSDSIVSGTVGMDQGMPMNDDLDSQIAKHMLQVMLDAEFSILNGSYQADGGSSATARKMRGISTAISTNSVNASSNALSKDYIDQLMVKMAEAETDVEQMFLMARPYHIALLNNLYANSIRSTEIGGVKLSVIYTAFGELKIVTNNQVASGELVVVNFEALTFEYTPSKGQMILVEDLSKLGAGDRAQIYMDGGINYTVEEYHGKLYGLATS